MEWLNLFKDFFGLNVPLAICILVALGIYNIFSKLLEERRKDYDMTFKSQARLIEVLNKTILIEIREYLIWKNCLITKGGRIKWE